MELSAKQTIHMKYQVLFSHNNTNIRMSSAIILLGILRVKMLNRTKGNWKQVKMKRNNL